MIETRVIPITRSLCHHSPLIAATPSLPVAQPTALINYFGPHRPSNDAEFGTCEGIGGCEAVFLNKIVLISIFLIAYIGSKCGSSSLMLTAQSSFQSAWWTFQKWGHLYTIKNKRCFVMPLLHFLLSPAFYCEIRVSAHCTITNSPILRDFLKISSTTLIVKRSMNWIRGYLPFWNNTMFYWRPLSLKFCEQVLCFHWAIESAGNGNIDQEYRQLNVI